MPQTNILWSIECQCIRQDSQGSFPVGNTLKAWIPEQKPQKNAVFLNQYFE